MSEWAVNIKCWKMNQDLVIVGWWSWWALYNWKFNLKFLNQDFFLNVFANLHYVTQLPLLRTSSPKLFSCRINRFSVRNCPGVWQLRTAFLISLSPSKTVFVKICQGIGQKVSLHMTASIRPCQDLSEFLFYLLM